MTARTAQSYRPAAPVYDLFNPPPSPTEDRDWGFELLKFWIRQQQSPRIEDVYSAFAAFFGLHQTDDQKAYTLSQAGLYSVRQLLEAGICRDERALHADAFETYITDCKRRNEQSRLAAQSRWIGASTARSIFCSVTAHTARLKSHLDRIEEAIAIVEEYYQDFTPASVRQAMIQIRERTYGGDNRIGVMAKAQPYASQYTVQIRGIIGPYNVANEGSGWSLQREAGSALFGFTKHYGELPTKEQLIDDLCVVDYLQTLPPTQIIRTDTADLPIYPTAREAFETGYMLRPCGQERSDHCPPLDREKALREVAACWATLHG